MVIFLYNFCKFVFWNVFVLSVVLFVCLDNINCGILFILVLYILFNK